MSSGHRAGSPSSTLKRVSSREMPLPNVHLGTSIEDRAALIERAGHLRKTPAAVRFFSCEPLLGDLGRVELSDIDWVICGGESGPGARPMHPDWARSLRDQCAAAGVPFFFKQIGQWGWPTPESHHADYAAACNGERPWPGDLLLDRDGKQLPGTSVQVGSRVYIRNIGKKKAGRLLDGVEHDAMPEAPHA
jgi:hypothetical protein